MNALACVAVVAALLIGMQIGARFAVMIVNRTSPGSREPDTAPRDRAALQEILALLSALQQFAAEPPEGRHGRSR